MSSVSRDMIEGHEETAKAIQEFLWEGKPHESKRIPRTEKELVDFMEGIREDSWRLYAEGAKSKGWEY